MTMLEWTLFCREHPHLLGGVSGANPPGGITDFARAYVSLASEEHMIQVLSQFQIHDHCLARLDAILIRYGPRSGLVYDPENSPFHVYQRALLHFRPSFKAQTHQQNSHRHP